MIREAVMTKKPSIADHVLLFRFFEDWGIKLEDVAKKTGYSVNYLKNLRSGGDKLTDGAKFKFITNYPETSGFLLGSKNEGGSG